MNTQIEKLKAEIVILEAKYKASTGRNAYTIGNKLRSKKALLSTLKT